MIITNEIHFNSFFIDLIKKKFKIVDFKQV